MATVPLFKCRHGNVMVCKGKHSFAFNSGRFWTEDPEQIKVLAELAARRGQGVFIDPKEPEIDPTATTPMDVMKRKIIKEYLEQQGIVKDAGEYAAPNMQASAASTASSVVNANSLADAVHDAKLVGDSLIPEKKEEGKAEGANPLLAKLEAMKQGKES